MVKGQCYNFVLNSAVAANANTRNCRFDINWPVDMPLNKAYKMRFSFCSAIGVFTNVDVANIFMDVGGGNTTVFASSEFAGQTAYKGGFIGLLQWFGTVNGKLYAATTDNPPVYFAQRPTQDFVRIEIHANGATQMAEYSVAPPQWTMVLSFEEQ